MHKVNDYLDKLPSFQQHQYRFAAHIRNPQENPLPADIEDRRMAIYRDLFFNNVAGFLQNGFPLIHALLSEQHWSEITHDFFANHHCKSPLFNEICEEFIGFLQEERNNPDDPEFLLELAHYEWVELALCILEETRPDDIQIDGDLLEQVPLVSQLAWPLAYQYPVHKISINNQPDTIPENPTFLIVYRDKNEKIQFIESNLITNQLIEIIQQGQTGKQALEQIANNMQHPNPKQLITAGHQILFQLRTKGILLGTKSNIKAQNNHQTIKANYHDKTS